MFPAPVTFHGLHLANTSCMSDILMGALYMIPPSAHNDMQGQVLLLHFRDEETEANEGRAVISLIRLYELSVWGKGPLSSEGGLQLSHRAYVVW